MKSLLTAFFSIPLLFRTILILPLQKLLDKRFQKRHAKFIGRNSGRRFFIYRNNIEATKYFEENIKPYLSESIEFINLKTDNSHIAKELLEILKHEDEFPIIMKIKSGELSKEKMYNKFYRSMFIEQSTVSILKELKQFYK